MERNCCKGGDCRLVEFSKLADPDYPIGDRVRKAACEVAGTCGSLTTEELRSCFGKLFEAPVECSLCDDFVAAYQIERDALSGKRDIERGTGPESEER